PHASTAGAIMSYNAWDLFDNFIYSRHSRAIQSVVLTDTDLL
ncbi:hypothetical protein J639_4176, partial [Acinetobacter baumannii 457946]